MKLVVCSTFRNCAPQLDRHIRQSKELLAAVEARGDEIEFLWGEGDSTDDTPHLLRAVVGPITVVDVSQGNRFFPSGENTPERWANVAAFSNQLLEHLPPCDVLVWVESDLYWTPETVLSLVDRVDEFGLIAAPMWREDGLWYDQWTTEKDGVYWHPPRGEGPIKVDSCAGLIAIRPDLLKPFPPEDACKGWTRNMGGVWLDTDLEATHPL